MEILVGQTKISLVQGDITKQAVDAIVNAANSKLLGGGGVDGAIHRAGGPAILEACRELRRTQHPKGLPAGQAVITTGGKLPARFVIHTVGPVWYGGTQGEAGVLADAYRNSLGVAVSIGVRTVAFPAISTGAYGYPIEKAARVALLAIRQFVVEHPGRLTEVRLVLFSPVDLHRFAQALQELVPGTN